MSSAEYLPQNSNPTRKLPRLKIFIRWLFIFLGICLLILAAILYFGMTFYYSSSLSQESDEEPVNIIPKPSSETNSPKAGFEEQRPPDEITDSSQIGDFAGLSGNDENQFSLEKTSHVISANQADALFRSVTEASYPENSNHSKVSTFIFFGASQTYQTSKMKTTLIQKKRPTDNKIPRGEQANKNPQETLPKIIQTKYEVTEACLPDQIAGTNCSGDMTVTFINGGRYENSLRLKPDGKDFVWNLSGKKQGTYSIIFKGDPDSPRKVIVKKCDCIIPIVTPTPINLPTPNNTNVVANNSNRSANGETKNNYNTYTSTSTVSPTGNSNGNNNINLDSAISPPDYADKFSYAYPSRFIKNTVYRVSLDLQPNDNGTSVGKTGDSAAVTVKLVENAALEIVEKPAGKQFYDRKASRWEWKIKLTEVGENSDAVQLKFNYQVEPKSGEKKYFQSNTSKGKVKTIEEQTPKSNGEISPEKPIPVGLPFPVKIVTFFLSSSGGLAFIFGVIPIWGRKKENDEVHCTLYAPETASAGTSFVIQVFAHLIEQAAGVETIVRELDEEAKKYASEKLGGKIKRGSTLTFKLTMPGLETAETEESGNWEGKPIEVRFIVSIPDNHASGRRFGKVSVYENNKKIGNIAFRIEILAGAQRMFQLPAVSLPLAQMSRKESAFVSYASEDKAEVYDCLRLLDGIGLSYHVDIINIAPGDRWEQKLYEFIDADDVFLLFWSKAASRSEWVIKEAERAHTRTGKERKNPPKIVIYHLETPPEAELPEWLKDIHYDRKWSQIGENVYQQSEARQKTINNGS